MAKTAVVSRRKIEGRPKVKTGCTTCRIRKVKCDETKPHCQRCVKTGRSCDGYESLFRNTTSNAINQTRAAAVEVDVIIQHTESDTTTLALPDTELLNRYFTVKTLLDVKLDCGDEATEILQASLANPPMRHAIMALVALRKDLRLSGNGSGLIATRTSTYDHGLKEYGLALKGLASNLSSPDSVGPKSALLCCQVFVSIEQVRGDYAAMGQHIVRGMRIMREYRARPSLATGSKLLAANRGQVPFLDAFLIKLFSAPCKFAEPPASTDNATAAASACPMAQPEITDGSPKLRSLVPDMRTELTRCATSALEFLDELARVDTVECALQLSLQREHLMGSLESWLVDLDFLYAKPPSSCSEPIAVSFMRLFHRIIRLAVLGSLLNSTECSAELDAEEDRLKAIAEIVRSRVKPYYTTSGVDNRQETRS